METKNNNLPMENNVEWRKTFKVEPHNGMIVFIGAFHKFGHYFGVIASFIENRERKDKFTDPAFKLVTENFMSPTEAGILKEFKTWLSINFGGKIYNLEEN